MYKRKKITALILIIFWMMIIFIFSNMPSEISDEKSRFVVNFISMLGLDINGGFADVLNHIVRKSAHFTEYAILFILIFNWLKYYFKLTPGLVLSLIFVFLYACTDEFHQLFVPGRAGRFTDVLIDTCGGAFAMIITYFYTTRIGHFSKRIRVF
ncbi:VanZ like family protein [Clostridium amylolyticum]|uniref:VanZ like family protein n=1 Tax=Clostridium amylolyticum TaxID=1121298 RepID=A0A1M6PK29_9CLOT|nr:VanZ family protein [Clostridium amylolyticum]SHK08326.1 VanZ like family protein [Clostridium amylolyticum]